MSIGIPFRPASCRWFLSCPLIVLLLTCGAASNIRAQSSASTQPTSRPITEKGTVLVEVPVKKVTIEQPGPLPDEDSRATQNFSLKIPPDYTELRWVIIEGDKDAEFSLNHDESGQPDACELDKISDGDVTAIVSGEWPYYIARVKAKGPFTIRIYARRYER